MTEHPTAREVAKARALLAQHRKARQKDRGPRISHQKAKPGRVRDFDYLSWLHEELPCVACLVLGPAPAEHAHIEAAHQKAQDADRGWHKKLGVRPDDARSAPLCAWHHRLGPLCCDPAQAKFWAVVNVDPIDLCDSLFAAFNAGLPGAPVVRQFAAMAAVRTLHSETAA